MNHNVPMTVDDYIEEKIQMIEEEFRITLTDDEKEHFRWLRTERDVDQYAHDIFSKKL